MLIYVLTMSRTVGTVFLHAFDRASALVRLTRNDPIIGAGLEFTIVSAISDVIHRLLLLLPALLLSGTLRS